MLLTFSLPKFENLIKENIKQNTIRADKNNRWKVGNSIQFWNGNPRNTRGKNKPYQFGTGVVKEVKNISIYVEKEIIVVGHLSYSLKHNLNRIAKKDGFNDWEEMKTFFKEDFQGKLIIWHQTNFNI